MGKIIDISQWQGNVNWSAVKSEVDLAILRVQYGSGKLDPKYSTYVAGAKKYKIPFGNYAYFLGKNVADAKEEAKDFWNRSDKAAQFYVIDAEEVTTSDRSDMVPAIQAFIDYLHGKGAKKVGLYTGDSFYKTYGLSKVKADFLWIARYGKDNGSPGTKPSIACDLWQYTSKGKVSGIGGYVDLNKLNGSKSLSYFTTGASAPSTPSNNNDSTMQLTQRGLDLIKSFEGLRLTAYKPVATETYYTIGYGHYGSDVKKGQTISKAQAESLLRKDTQSFVDAVNKGVKTKLNSNQFDALVSIAYNIGKTAFANSTLLKCVNQRKFSDAAKEFLRWNKADGKVLKGLVDRRAKESALFLSASSEPSTPPPTDNGGGNNGGSNGGGNSDNDPPPTNAYYPPTEPEEPVYHPEPVEEEEEEKDSTPPYEYDTTFINPNSLISGQIVNQGDKVPKPRIYLYNSSRLYGLGEIHLANNRNASFNFTTVSELSFSIPYTIMNDNIPQRNPMVDLIKIGFLIKLTWAGIETWFVVNKKEITGNEQEWLNVSCYSQEYELSQKKMIGYKATSYNCLQVLGDTLKHTGWKIGYINDEFNLKYHQFDVSSTSKLDFINEICTTFDAYVVYDTVNKKVNICKEDEVSIYKGFWIEYGKYLKSINQTEDNDEIKTRLHVSGSDGVNINTINPTGQSYIDDFSYYLYPFERNENGDVIAHSDSLMSDELCDAIIAYNKLVDANDSVFQTLVTNREKLQEELTLLENKLDTLKEDLRVILDNIQINKQNNFSNTEEIKKRDAKQLAINEQKALITEKNKDIDANNSAIKNLNELLKMENNFSAALLDELTPFIKEDEYSDTSKTSAADLYEGAIAQLRKSSIPPVNLSIDMINFFQVFEESPNWDRFSIGDSIRIRHPKLGIDVKATVDKIGIDFENYSMSVNISNTKRPKNIQEKMANALYVIDKVKTDYSKRKPDWNNLLSNFNLRNDRIKTKPADPTLPLTASVRHTNNDNGSVDITFSWYYDDYTKSKKDADNIDGFIVYMYSDTVSDKYVFGSKEASENYVPLSPDKRSYKFPSVPANRYYTFGIKAYRSVDDDISREGILYSNIITSTIPKENPYQPSPTVNINGKVNGISFVTPESIPAQTETGSSTIVVDSKTNQIGFATPTGVAPIQTGDSTSVNGHTPDTSNTPNTIPVRNELGLIDASITGDAKTVQGKTPGFANGIATLDSKGKVPSTQLAVFASGTYVGSGSSKLIPVPFSPTLVKVYTTDSSDSSLFIPSTSGGMLFGANNVLSSQSTSYGKLDVSGFYTGSTYGSKLSVTYYWEAYRS